MIYSVRQQQASSTKHGMRKQWETHETNMGLSSCGKINRRIVAIRDKRTCNILKWDKNRHRASINDDNYVFQNVLLTINNSLKCLNCTWKNSWTQTVDCACETCLQLAACLFDNVVRTSSSIQMASDWKRNLLLFISPLFSFICNINKTSQCIIVSSSPCLRCWCCEYIIHYFNYVVMFSSSSSSSSTVDFLIFVFLSNNWTHLCLCLLFGISGLFFPTPARITWIWGQHFQTQEKPTDGMNESFQIEWVP